MSFLNLVVEAGSGTKAPSGWFLVVWAAVGLATVLGVRRYTIRRTADTKDRSALSEDERLFRAMLMADVDKLRNRVGETEARLAKVQADLGTALGERNAATKRAETAESEVARLRTIVEKQDDRIEKANDRILHLESEVLLLNSKMPPTPEGTHE